MKFINVCALLAATAQAAPLLTDAVTQGVGGATGGASSLPGAGAGALKARQEEDAGEASQTLQQPAQSNKEGGLLGGILKARQVDGAADPIPADTGAAAAADAGAADAVADADAADADAGADADAADAADAGADAAQAAQAAPQQGGLGGLLRRSLEIRQEADAGAAAGAADTGADAGAADAVADADAADAGAGADADAGAAADAGADADAADAGADAAQSAQAAPQQGGLGGLLRRSLETRQDDEADEAADV